MQNTIKISKIMIGSFFVLILFCGLYFIAEHLAIVPWIGLYDPPSDFAESSFDLTRWELIISMVFFTEIAWVGLWIGWFKLCGYTLEW